MASIQKGFPHQVLEASELERQTASQISLETIIEVADMIKTVEGMGVQVDWINQEIRKIVEAQDQ